MRRLALVLLLLLPAAVACGIQPTGVVDLGKAPVVSVKPTFRTVYLLRKGRLEPQRVSTASGTVDDVIEALFKAGDQHLGGMNSALKGFRHADTQVTNYGRVLRNDPDRPIGLRLHVFLSGDGRVSRAALAQLTCTAMLSKEIWVVQVTQISSHGTPSSRGDHVCSEFRDLAGSDTQLPP
ncbi:hypothetical protein Misp01_24960 [Microtetraspora sp. NBRC 13810]|uniref:hypothetical protein n=1 Tax=Microtetraspora sp. NBRC 13810 TaxID=3030990 RepID=UPI0024A061ED|nr:hypothetical protein [Microtetraspora sp. NBRC 13810]GLW07366.1 hypothetical protein Misp01_24960 [Microtetraspora sp. NBRC 13810]